MDEQDQTTPVTPQNKAPLDLASLINKQSDELRATVEFEDGFFFEMRFVPRSTVEKLQAECLVFKYNKNTKRREPTMDSKKLVQRFCSLAVGGWKGATPRRLGKYVPLKDVPEDRMDDEIPFSQEALVMLVENSVDVDSFLQQTAPDLSFFNNQHGEQLKNS